MTQPAVSRFEALDALRGVCALMVVLFHLPISSHFHALELTRHGYLFVDFFFVLSGFVIAHAYGARIRTAGEAGRFMVRRLGRVWPLHAALLLAFIGIEVARVIFAFDGVTPFTGDRAPEAIVTNLLLVQALGIHDSLTWNGAAWSISVEVAAYAVFAALVLLAPRRFGLWAAVIAIAGALIVLNFAPRFMNTTYNFGFPRAAWGFFLGCLVHRGWIARPAWPTGRFADLAEVACLIAAVAFVTVARGPWTVLAPVVFAACVWVFAREAGLASRLLRARPFLKLGEWSYSIYMTHMLVITLMLIGARQVGGLMVGPRIDLGSVWINDLAALGVIGFICGLSALTYRVIEAPGRDLVNGWTARRPGAARSAAVMAGAPAG